MKRFIGTAALTTILLTLAVTPAGAFKDADAREQIRVLTEQVNQMESSLQVRQMGLGEQVQAVREELARIEGKVDENSRDARLAAQQLEVAKIETQEALVTLNNDYKQRFRLVDENINRLLKGIEDLQKNIRTLNANLQTMSDFEQKQEDRIGQLHGQLQEQLNVVVEEVGQENFRLQQEIASMGRDVAKFQGLINTVDGRVQSISGQVRQVMRRQGELAQALQAQAAAASTAAPSSGGGHVVRKGETLSLIAAQYGLTVEQIMAANGLADANLIREGQTLTIPAP